MDSFLAALHGLPNWLVMGVFLLGVAPLMVVTLSERLYHRSLAAGQAHMAPLYLRDYLREHDLRLAFKPGETENTIMLHKRGMFITEVRQTMVPEGFARLASTVYTKSGTPETRDDILTHLGLPLEPGALYHHLKGWYDRTEGHVQHHLTNLRPRPLATMPWGEPRN